jgi:hypothetical protein
MRGSHRRLQFLVISMRPQRGPDIFRRSQESYSSAVALQEPDGIVEPDFRPKRKSVPFARRLPGRRIDRGMVRLAGFLHGCSRDAGGGDCAGHDGLESGIELPALERRRPCRCPRSSRRARPRALSGCRRRNVQPPRFGRVPRMAPYAAKPAPRAGHRVGQSRAGEPKHPPRPRCRPSSRWH